MRHEARREGSYLSVITRDRQGAISTFVRDIRGGLVWRSPISPNYFLVVAQRTDMNQQGKLPLAVLAEHEDELPTRLFKKLLEVGARLSCPEFYADLRLENRDMHTLFRDYARYHGTGRVQSWGG